MEERPTKRRREGSGNISAAGRETPASLSFPASGEDPQTQQAWGATAETAEGHHSTRRIELLVYVVSPDDARFPEEGLPRSGLHVQLAGNNPVSRNTIVHDVRHCPFGTTAQFASKGVLFKSFPVKYRLRLSFNNWLNGME